MKRITPDGVAVFSAQLRVAQQSMSNLWNEANLGQIAPEHAANVVLLYVRRITDIANHYIIDDRQESTPPSQD